MSRAFVFVVRSRVVEIQQGCIEPFALRDEPRMLVLENIEAMLRFLEFGFRAAPAAGARDIAFHAFELDLGAAARTLVPELHLVVADAAFDHIVSGNYPFLGELLV